MNAKMRRHKQHHQFQFTVDIFAAVLNTLHSAHTQPMLNAHTLIMDEYGRRNYLIQFRMDMLFLFSIVIIMVFDDSNEINNWQRAHKIVLRFRALNRIKYYTKLRQNEWWKTTAFIGSVMGAIIH